MMLGHMDSQMWEWMSQSVGTSQMSSLVWFWQLQWLVLWGLTVALLAAAIRWLWKKGNR